MFKLFENIKVKIIYIIVMIFLFVFASSNTYSLQTIDCLAYVVALGIDVADNNNIKLSIQIAKPDSISSNSSGQSSASIITSVECSSIQEGICLFDSHISRTINLSHCKIIVFSEQLAYNGISTYLNDLSNNVQISNHAKIIVSKCDASTFLELTNPTLESFPARYYEIVDSAGITTSLTHGITLIDFYSTYNSDFQEPIAILSGINNNETHSSLSSSSYINKDNSFIAGQTPIESQNNVENMGLAVFKDNKLVGELTGLDSICHLMINGELKNCILQVENPKDETQIIDLKIRLKNKPQIKVKIVNGSPFIEIKVNLNFQIISSDGSVDFTNKTNISELENKVNNNIENILQDYLYKISKTYNSDIEGFGRYAIKYFLTNESWIEYNWLNSFNNSFFKINVNSSLKSTSNFITG